MSSSIENIQSAMSRAEQIKPRVGGFPYLAETLRQAGVTRNHWSLPSCQSVFISQNGNVVVVGNPIIGGMQEVPAFDRDALVFAIRTDQAGDSTFQNFSKRCGKRE